MKIPEDILNQIKIEFGPSSDQAEKTIYENSDILQRETYRVIRAVVFLAEGDLSTLSKLIGVARADYRDILFWAEYTNLTNKNPLRIRDFNQPFGHHELSAKAQKAGRLPEDVKRFLKRKK